MFCRLVQKRVIICIKRADCFYFANNFNVSVKLVMPRRFQTTWLVGNPSSYSPPYSGLQKALSTTNTNTDRNTKHYYLVVSLSPLRVCYRFLITLSLPGRTAKPSATRSCSTNRSQLFLHHHTRSFLILAV